MMKKNIEKSDGNNPKKSDKKNNKKITDRMRVRAACIVFRSAFPRSPEGNMFYLLIEQCLRDLTRKPYKNCRNYVLREINHDKEATLEFFESPALDILEVIGVNPDWVRLTVILAGLKIKSPTERG